jgi:hypothetical protein
MPQDETIYYSNFTIRMGAALGLLLHDHSNDLAAIRFDLSLWCLERRDSIKTFCLSTPMRPDESDPAST